MEAIAGENLKALFTGEKWQDLFATLSDTLGFTLQIFAENGAPIFVPRGADLFCSSFRSLSPDFSARCEAYCYPGIIGAIGSGKPEIFKCCAKIMNFSLPIEFMGEKAVILGQGSFATYEDFREFMNMINSSGGGNISIPMPLTFTGPQEAGKVQAFVADSINRLLRNSHETVTLRRKFESLKSIVSAWGESDGQQPDDLYRDMIRRLTMLLEIEGIALLTEDPHQQRYTVKYHYLGAKNGGKTEALGIADELVRDMLGGKPFVTSQPARASQTDFLGNARCVYFFPLMINRRLEAVLRIEDRALDESEIQIITGFCRQATLSIENHRLRHDLYKKFDRFAAILDLTSDVARIQNEKPLLQIILDKSAELLKAEQGSLMVLDREANVLLIEAKKGMVSTVTGAVKISRGQGIAGKVAERGEPMLVENLEKDPRVKQKNRKHYKTRSFLSVPLKIDDRIIGVLNLSDKDTGEAFNEEDLKLIQSFATQAALLMERDIFINKTEHLKKLTITDDLTGLLNRRYLYERLKDELARSERHGHHLSLLMLDLDGFKTCNDSYGHLVGDQMLKHVADTLLNTVRSMDVVARYGGDEFMVILPETGQSVALEIAERLRRNVSNKAGQSRNGADPDACALTTSIGIACYPEHGKTNELLLKNVDAALYRAKKKGKNSIEVFS